MAWWQTITRAFRLLGEGFKNSRGLSSFLHTPGSAYDFQREAGKVYDNSIVLPGINWKASSAGEARLVIERLNDRGEWEIASSRDPRVERALNILRKPNPWYNGRTLLRAMQLSWDISGNVYALIDRGDGGRPERLVWLPHGSVIIKSDRGNADGAELITHYAYKPVGGGQEIDIDPEQMVHLRFGVDPDDWRKGLSPLAATLRDICTENELGLWVASLSRNMATPSMIVSPSPTTVGNGPEPEQLERIKAKMQAQIRDRRGEPITLGYPVDVKIPSFSPQQMDLGKIRQQPISNICAALGFDPMVLGFSTDRQTFANKEQAIDDAGKRTIIPQLVDWAEQLSEKLLPMFGLDPVTYRYRWTTTGVSWLVDDTDKLHERSRADYQAGIITLNEARVPLGLAEVPEGTAFYMDPAPQAAQKSAKLRALRQQVAARAMGDAWDRDDA